MNERRKEKRKKEKNNETVQGRIVAKAGSSKEGRTKAWINQQHLTVSASFALYR